MGILRVENKKGAGGAGPNHIYPAENEDDARDRLVHKKSGKAVNDIDLPLYVDAEDQGIWYEVKQQMLEARTPKKILSGSAKGSPEAEARDRMRLNFQSSSLK